MALIGGDMRGTFLVLSRVRRCRSGMLTWVFIFCRACLSCKHPNYFYSSVHPSINFIHSLTHPSNNHLFSPSPSPIHQSINQVPPTWVLGVEVASLLALLPVFSGLCQKMRMKRLLRNGSLLLWAAEACAAEAKATKAADGSLSKLI